MTKICIFSGTTEGRELARRLCGRGAQITVCTATEYGGGLNDDLPDTRIRNGRMDAAQMIAFFKEEGFICAVDATHPYACEATENIRHACEQTHTEYLRLFRQSGAGADDGIFVPDAHACAAYLQKTQGNILLTTGSKELPVLCADEEIRRRCYVRVLPLPASLDICAQYGVKPERIIAMQGPFDTALNLAMLRAFDARYLVTKDSGNTGGYESKIRAAKQAGVQAVVIGRPTQESGQPLEEIASLLESRCALSPLRKKVTLIGAGMGNDATRTIGMQRALEEADCLIGASRMLDMVPEKPRYEAVRAEEIARIIHSDPVHRRFAVLLSGDSGFYSGAKRLTHALEGLDVEILPGIGSLSYLCARLGRNWDDVHALSLHGRKGNLIHAVQTHPAVFALLGGDNGASQALQSLCDAGLGHLQACVGERLGYPEERISRADVRTLSSGVYDALSVLLVENPASIHHVVTHGLADEAFERGDAPMTKSEVRSISLSKLALTRDAMVYDVGAGSGSVAVEAAMQASEGMVYAIEMKEAAVLLTKQNQQKHGISNMQVICGKAPEALEHLPAPTHVFIGGSCGSLRGIIDCILCKNPHARIVANAVTLETIAELSQIARKFTESEVVQVSVAKGRPVGSYRLMTAQNPVYIFTLQNGGNA